jgi:hypothetical protein
MRTQMEEQQCFAATDPDTGKRPDISILPGYISDKKTILDIMITCPVSELLKKTTIFETFAKKGNWTRK